jgi:Icc-related predicted phosphoesterase
VQGESDVTIRILALSDFHGATHILDILMAKIDLISPDVITFSGDIVKGHSRGDEWLQAHDEKRTPKMTKDIRKEEKEDLEFYQVFFSFLDEVKVPSFVVPGNMDAPESRFLQACPQPRSVHQTMVRTPVGIAGFGGELTEEQEETTFVLQYPREKVIEAMKPFSDKEISILITHSPPVSSLSSEDGQEKGSDVVNYLVDLLRPEYLVCGHAHNAQNSEWIKTTLAVNPGAAKYGNYAVIEGDMVEFGRLV